METNCHKACAKTLWPIINESSVAMSLLNAISNAYVHTKNFNTTCLLAILSLNETLKLRTNAMILMQCAYPFKENLIIRRATNMMGMCYD